MMFDSPSLLVVLFDLDQTLIDRQAAMEMMLAECFHGQDDIIQRMRELDRNGEGDRDVFFHHWCQLSGRPMNQTIFAERLAAQLRPDLGLITALRRWTRGITTGIITNGGFLTQRLKLRASGLDSVFADKQIWISEAMGISKPDPMVFVRVCRELGVHPTRCIYIGDSLENDFAPARHAGLMALQVREPLTGPSLISLRGQLMHVAPRFRRHHSS